jgi:hypothetical protein
MKLRFTTKDENIKPFVCLRHGQMSIKCIFVLNAYFGAFNANQYISPCILRLLPVALRGAFVALLELSVEVIYI